MRVIFLQDVPRVGKRHDIKEVSDGYALNFLLPRRLAVLATSKAMIELEIRQKEVIIEREVKKSLLLKNLEEIKEKPIKEVGEFEIPISIKGKKSSFKLIVEKI